MKFGASSEPLESVKEALVTEVQAEFLRFIENMHARLVVADVENSLSEYAKMYAKIVSETLPVEDDF
jgi:hypothetical protein